MIIRHPEKINNPSNPIKKKKKILEQKALEEELQAQKQEIISEE